MSDNQVATMFQADDSYAGSETCNRLMKVLKEVFGTEFFLPAHQGRACENILAETFVKPGDVVPMNYHFTTTKSHITRRGGSVVEVIDEKGLVAQSNNPFKGNFDLVRLEEIIKEVGPEHVPFVRIEAGTNLIGGLKWIEEPNVLRFFFGRLVPIGDWQEKLAAKFREDFGDSL